MQIDTKKVEEHAEQRNRMDNDLETGVQGCSEAGGVGVMTACGEEGRLGR